MQRIGIYGGAFNPPHIGHVRAASYAVSALNLCGLFVIPSCVSPHKESPVFTATPEQRLEMLRLAFKETDKVTVSDMELSRGGVSYTYETVAQLRREHPDAELVLLMGTDMFLSFLTWKSPEIILENASLGVFYRGDWEEKERIEQQKAVLEKMGAKVYLVENPVTVISSTDLRRMQIFGCAEAFLPPAVAAYIQENKLYQSKEGYKNLSEKELESAVTSLLKPNRVKHVLGCRDTAVAMAKHWGADPVDAARAGLLHDVTKALSGSLQIALCKAYQEELGDFFTKNTKPLHALTGSLVAERVFGENPAVVQAIRFHTTGKANMNLLEKIIYVADYMEPNRDFSGVETLRELAFSDLDGALKLGLEMTLSLLKEQGSEVSPESREALEYLNNQKEGKRLC